jgi:hypothetical protein
MLPPQLGALAMQYHSHSQNIIFWTSDPNDYFISITLIIIIIHDTLFNCMNENVTIFHLFLLYLCDPVLVE